MGALPVTILQFTEPAQHVGRLLDLHLEREARIPELVGNQQGCHEEKAVVPDLAELARQLVDPRFDMGSELQQAAFLAVAAREPVVAAVDDNRNLAHRPFFAARIGRAVL